MMNTTKQGSRFEYEARALKVDAILALVPWGANEQENAALATVLVGWSQADRDRFAAAAGQRSPSTETWAWVVAGVRARRGAVAVLGQVSL